MVVIFFFRKLESRISRNMHLVTMFYNQNRHIMIFILKHHCDHFQKSWPSMSVCMCLDKRITKDTLPVSIGVENGSPYLLQLRSQSTAPLRCTRIYANFSFRVVWSPIPISIILTFAVQDRTFKGREAMLFIILF